MDFWETLTVGQILLLIVALGIAFGFECVNGFHDTANAVATVIYTNSLKPTQAVVWSGIWNFIGVLAGGIGIAYSIVYLLPVEALVQINTNAGLAMVMALLLSAIVWNVGTWYLGLPASSSHALIGSILGAALMNGLLAGKELGAGVNWEKAAEVGLALLISPLIGFLLAFLLLLLLKALVRRPDLYSTPPKGTPPPWWIRGILLFTCTGVSFAHGSNDGQKGMGLIMLILIGLVPAHYALNVHADEQQVKAVYTAIVKLDQALREAGVPEPMPKDYPQTGLTDCRKELQELRRLLAGKKSFAEIPANDRWQFRTDLLELRRYKNDIRNAVPQARRAEVEEFYQAIHEPAEYVPLWVVFGVALALGIGTMIGWKRIVVTVGEKIGKSHLTYAQGACAELVAMSTIGLALVTQLPVSTTHVLSSGVAGTMTANKSGIDPATVKKIAWAWVLTLPATLLMSALLYGLFRIVV